MSWSSKSEATDDLDPPYYPILLHLTIVQYLMIGLVSRMFEDGGSLQPIYAEEMKCALTWRRRMVPFMGAHKYNHSFKEWYKKSWYYILWLQIRNYIKRWLLTLSNNSWFRICFQQLKISIEGFGLLDDDLKHPLFFLVNRSDMGQYPHHFFAISLLLQLNLNPLQLLASTFQQI